MHPNPAIAALEAEAGRLMAAGRQAEAAQRYRDLLQRDPGNWTARQFAAWEALEREDFAAAAALYRELVAQAPQSIELQYNLAIALHADGQREQALGALDACLDLQPENLYVLLRRGMVCEELGREEEAGRAYLRALRLAETQDPARFPPDLRYALHQAQGTVCGQLDRAIDAALQPLRERHGAAAIARLQKAADMFTGKLPFARNHPKWRPGFFYVPDLPVRRFFDRSEFAWAAEAEAATEAVREEMLAVLGQGEGFAPYVNHPEGSAAARTWQGINRNPSWSTFHLYRHGERVEANCARCPRTAALLDAIDLHRVPGYGPEAMFSVLRPRTRIPPHFGSVNGRLIVHLPLVVPPDCGALRCDEEQRAWREGELMIFDDAFEHEAWNDSDSTRVVLIFDTWRPDLSAAEREAFGAILQTARRFERHYYQ
jgi:aspartate beta-hydroxylase